MPVDDDDGMVVEGRGLEINHENSSIIVGQLSPCGSSDELDSEGDSNNDDIGSNFSNSNSSKRQKRGILPKHATSVMRAWLFQHLVVSTTTIWDLFTTAILLGLDGSYT